MTSFYKNPEDQCSITALQLLSAVVKDFFISVDYYCITPEVLYEVYTYRDSRNYIN